MLLTTTPPNSSFKGQNWVLPLLASLWAVASEVSIDWLSLQYSRSYNNTNFTMQLHNIIRAMTYLVVLYILLLRNKWWIRKYNYSHSKYCTWWFSKYAINQTDKSLPLYTPIWHHVIYIMWFLFYYTSHTISTV